MAPRVFMKTIYSLFFWICVYFLVISLFVICEQILSYLKPQKCQAFSLLGHASSTPSAFTLHLPYFLKRCSLLLTPLFLLLLRWNGLLLISRCLHP